MQNDSDGQLIVNYLQGDEESLKFLFQRYLKPIYTFVFRLVGDARQAEDTTQEVFVKVWRYLKKFDQNRNFKTWIFSIAKNSAVDFLRKKKDIPFSEFADAENEGENFLENNLVDPACLPPEILERADIAQKLNLAMEKLPLKYQMVLSLRYNDHFNFREIAESLEESLHTIKSRHRRALVKMKKLLTEK